MGKLLLQSKGVTVLGFAVTKGFLEWKMIIEWKANGKCMSAVYRSHYISQPRMHKNATF